MNNFLTIDLLNPRTQSLVTGSLSAFFKQPLFPCRIIINLPNSKLGKIILNFLTFHITFFFSFLKIHPLTNCIKFPIFSKVGVNVMSPYRMVYNSLSASQSSTWKVIRYLFYAHTTNFLLTHTFTITNLTNLLLWYILLSFYFISTRVLRAWHWGRDT